MNHDENDYLSWRTTKLEFEGLIVDTLLDLLSDPAMNGKKADGTAMNLTELAGYNQLIALYNSGIKDFANALLKALDGEKGDDSDE